MMTDNAHLAPRFPFFGSLRARLQGPGGLYNLGNLFGLVTGLWLQVILLKGMTVWAFLMGSPSAIALTLSMVIFFWSGEAYHRAWVARNAPDAGLNRLGDRLSGFGALLLGLGLMFLGQPVLAATAGLLHALGKFGSAGDWSQPRLLARGFNGDGWRGLVVLSRAPALLAVLLEIAQTLVAPTEGLFVDLFGPVTLLGCYLMWLRADVLLFGCSKT